MKKRDFYLPRKNRDKLLEELEWEQKELAYSEKEKDKAGITEAKRMIARINERLKK